MSLSEVLPGAFSSPEEPPQRRRGAAREQRKRKKRRRRRSIFAILLTFIVVGGGIGGAYLGLSPLIHQLTEPKDFTGSGAGEAQVKIAAGDSGRTIARELTAKGVTKTQVAFLDAFKADPSATSIQPGTYALHKKMSASSALALLLDPKSRLTFTVTVKEGLTANQTLDLLATKLKLSRSDLKKASTSGDIGLPAAADGKPEGYLFPATYDFQPDVTATQALSALVERGQAAYTDLGISDSQLHDIVIKASIVQKEARSVTDMGKVARVLDNRLAKPMKLQLDSTVSYATGKPGVTTTSKDRQSSSRYNTYRYAGLPVGPISNPGEAALKAALDPTPGHWLYFVTVNLDTGETKFADNPTQHGIYVKEFQAWMNKQ